MDWKMGVKHPESISIELPKTLNFDGIQRLFAQGHHCESAVWGDQNLIDWFEEDISDWCFKYSNHPLAQKVVQQQKILGLQQNLQITDNFPNSSFGQQLANIVGILLNDIPVKVLHATQNGYDTHLGQPKRLEKLYSELNECLLTLMSHLRRAGLVELTTVLIYSEFGRSIDENDNLGTVHGTSGLCVLLGAPTIQNTFARSISSLPIENSKRGLVLGNQYLVREVQRKIIEWL